MSPGGGELRYLTDSWQDEAPTWSPNGRIIQFFRTERGSGKASLWQVDLTGRNERRLPTPVDASDPGLGADPAMSPAIRLRATPEGSKGECHEPLPRSPCACCSPRASRCRPAPAKAPKAAAARSRRRRGDDRQRRRHGHRRATPGSQADFVALDDGPGHDLFRHRPLQHRQRRRRRAAQPRRNG